VSGAPGSGTVRAAGTVLWAAAPDGLRVALVHRPRRGDWSLPKGKLDAGESEREAALRETLEETGWRGAPGPELGTVRYRAGGRPKTVRYWALLASDGTFTANAEVDELAWLPVPEARQRCTYAQDRAVLDWFVAAVAGRCADAETTDEPIDEAAGGTAR